VKGRPSREGAGAGPLDCVATASLPVGVGVNAGGGRVMKLMVFASTTGAEELLALVHGTPRHPDEPVLVRLHSACLTGDVFGSLRCDCGSQLAHAMRAITASPPGVLVYFTQHEGRGIGILNKVRAYALQDGGLDTVKANHALGFPTDLRVFDAGAAVLRHLGIRRVRLMTNNPEKVEALERADLEVVERVAIPVDVNRYNRRYLEVKRDVLGHCVAPDSLPTPELTKTGHFPPAPEAGR
jgi:3,4-dihydroxy 2-butanone 4-phosphate synthase/GTP cyclohydrolase II